MVEINMVSAILFVVIASCFLITLYKKMSHLFVKILVVIFCIGGVEVCTISFVCCICLNCAFVLPKIKSPKCQIPICFDNTFSHLREHLDSFIFICNSLFLDM